MTIPASVSDYRELARKKLPRQLFDLVDGGACHELTLRDNEADLNSIRLRQKVFCDVSGIDTGTRVLDQDLKIPVVLAPIGFAGLLAGRAEVQAAAAAKSFGVPFCLSTVSICPLEEIRQKTDNPFWFQLYIIKDRGFIVDILQRAKAAGCNTLVLTVDLAVLGMRYRDLRNGLGPNPPLASKLRSLWDFASHPSWVRDVALGGRPLSFGNLSSAVPKARKPGDFKRWIDSQFDSGVTWADVELVRKHWDGPLIIKGVLTSEDAVAAADAGAQAIVVSNHGGRQLDSAPSTISVLPKIADAVGDRLEILMDGGVRSGQDVIKAIASGARACMVGRAWAYSVAARGQRGVEEVLNIMKREMEISMALLGTRSIREISPAVLEHRNQ